MKLLKLVIGALGGLSATGPMTILMELLHRKLPTTQRYPLPPREITKQIAARAGLGQKLENEEAGASAVLLSHFAYGAAVGALYALVFGKIPENGLIKGPLFGALVWVVSYLGFLPAATVLRSATKHPPQRNALMFTAHILWGLILGLFVESVLEEKQRVFGAFISQSPIPSKDIHG